MADVNEQLVIELRADISDLKREFSQIGAVVANEGRIIQQSANQSAQDIERIGDAANNQTGQIEGSSKKQGSALAGIGKAGALAFAAVGAAALAAAGVAIAAIGSMNSELSKGTGKIQAMTGVSKAEAKKISQAGVDAWSKGWGESIEDVSEVGAVMTRNLGKSMQGFEKEVIKGSVVLRDTFGVEANETGRAVASMVENFDMKDPIKAMDILTKTLQGTKGDAGELLDTFWEYAPKINEIGFSAEEFGLILQKASQNGAISLDFVGDAMKEFSIRAIDGSKTTTEGFAAIGLSSEEMAKKFAAGGEVSKKAFYETIQGLKAIEDPIARNKAGVELFGTKWEDLGEDVILSMDVSKEALGGMNGATKAAGDALSDNLGAKITEIKRTLMTPFLDADSPIYQALNDIADYALVELPKVVKWIENVMDSLGKKPKKDEVSPMMAQWKSTMKEIEPLLKGLTYAGIFAGNVFAEMGKIFTESFKFASIVVGGTVTTVYKFFESIIRWSVDAAKAVGLIFKGDFKGANDLMKDATKRMGRDFDSMGKSISESWDRTTELTEESTVTNWDAILKKTDTTFNKVFKKVEEAPVKSRKVFDTETGKFVFVAEKNFSNMSKQGIKQFDDLDKGATKSAESAKQNVTKKFDETAKGIPSVLAKQNGSVNASAKNLGNETIKGSSLGLASLGSTWNSQFGRLPSEIAKQNAPVNTAGATVGANAKGGVATGILGTDGKVRTEISKLPGAIAGYNTSSWNAGSGVGANAKGGVGSGILGASGKAGSEFAKVPGAITYYKGSANTAGSSVGTSAKNGLATGSSGTRTIGDNVGSGFKIGLEKWSLSAKIKNVALAIGNTVKTAWINMFKTKSPSRWAIGIGGNVTEGLGIGLEDEKDGAVKSAMSVADSVKGSFGELEKGIQVGVGFKADESALKDSLLQTNAMANYTVQKSQSSQAKIEIDVKGELAPLIQQLEIRIANNIFNQIGGRGLLT